MKLVAWAFLDVSGEKSFFHNQICIVPPFAQKVSVLWRLPENETLKWG